MGAAALATALLPTSTKDSLLQTLVIAGSPWDAVAPLWGLELRRLAELGTEAVGTSAVTKRVMTQLEGACDKYMWGWEEEYWWRRLEMRLNMLAKSAGEEISKAARLETQVRFCLSTKTSCLSEALPPTHMEVCLYEHICSTLMQ